MMLRYAAGFCVWNLSLPLDLHSKTQIHLGIYSPQDTIIHTCIKVPWTVLLKSCDFRCIFTLENLKLYAILILI